MANKGTATGTWLPENLWHASPSLPQLQQQFCMRRQHMLQP